MASTRCLLRGSGVSVAASTRVVKHLLALLADAKSLESKGLPGVNPKLLFVARARVTAARKPGAGSLKTEDLQRRYFRAHLSAAPLKREQLAALVPGCTVFPRSSERGPIEARRL